MGLGAVLGVAQLFFLGAEVAIVTIGAINDKKAAKQLIKDQEHGATFAADIKILNVDTATVGAIPVM